MTTGIGEPLLGGGDQLLDAEHRRAVAEEADDRARRVGDLCADRGGQPVAEGGVAGRVEQPVGGRERPVVHGAVVGDLRAVPRDDRVGAAGPRRSAPLDRRPRPGVGGPRPRRSHRRCACAGRPVAIANPLSRSTSTRRAQDDGGVADDGEVGGARSCASAPGRGRPVRPSAPRAARPHDAAPQVGVAELGLPTTSSTSASFITRARPAAGRRHRATRGAVSSRTPLPLTVVRTGMP